MIGNIISLGNADWKLTMWKEIYNRARDKEKVVKTTLEPYNFEYALINPSDQYGRIRTSKDGTNYQYTGKDVTFWIKDAEKVDKVGFNFGGLAFVLERGLPRKDFADYVGIHEWIEAKSQATEGLESEIHDRMIHGKGCRNELYQVLKREKEFVDEYAKWLVSLTKSAKNPKDSYFPRAIPEFLDIIKEGKLSPTEIVKKFKDQLDYDYYINNFSSLNLNNSECSLL